MKSIGSRPIPAVSSPSSLFRHGVALLLLLIGLPLPAQIRYETLELSFSTTQSYSNPFTQVSLTVTFSAPSGTTTVRGFHDGNGAGGQTGNVWKCRYMPTEEGTHTWESFSTDSQLDGMTGEFECVAASGGGIFLEHGPVHIHPQYPHAVAHHDRTPFRWNGDTEWFFLTHVSSRISQAQRLTAIDFLASKQVNNLLMIMVNSDGGLYTFPWPGNTAPTSHLHFDLARLREWEATIAHMQARGIIADWFYADDSASILPAALSAAEDLYFHYMLARFGAFANVTWNLALEYSEYRSGSWVTNRAALVKAERPGAFLAVHQSPGDTYHFPGNPHLDHTSLQRFALHDALNSAVRGVRTATAHAGRPIPVCHDEFSIEGANNGDPNVHRRDVWAIMLAGGFPRGASLGFWIGTPYTTGQHFDHQRIAHETITRCEWWRMEPRNDLVQSGGTGRYALAWIDGGAGEILSYSVSGASWTIDLSALQGTLDAEYVDPLSGATQEGTLSGGGGATVQNPFGAGEVDPWPRRRWIRFVIGQREHRQRAPDFGALPIGEHEVEPREERDLGSQFLGPPLR